MSTTALILTLSVKYRANMIAEHGAAAAESALYTTAARLIAGDYRN
jgi:hypothetical protein